MTTPLKNSLFVALLIVFVASSALNADVLESSAYQFFGISSGYNNVFFGDYYGRNGDIEGHAAIQGNVDVQSYGFGAGQQANHQEGPVLVVGGNVHASGAGVYDGDAYIGGKMTSQTGSMWNALGVGGTAPYNSTCPDYVGTPGTVYVNDASNFLQWGPEYNQSFADAGISSIPFDFTVAKEQLQTVSSELWGYSNTGTGGFDANGNYVVDLTGQTGLQVVTVDAAVFAALSDANRNFMVFGDSDTTLVLNVSDVTGLNSLNLTKEIIINGIAGVHYDDFDGSNILINTDVENVVVAYSEITASVLALNAHFDVTHGHISGQAFGSSATTTSGGEFHAYYTFDDKHFGSPATTPEPGTMLIFGLGIGVFGLSRRFRKNNR